MKTLSSAAARFKRLASGKFIRTVAGLNHNLGKKSVGRIRGLKGWRQVDNSMTRFLKRAGI